MAALSFDSPATRWLHAASRVVDWLEPRLGEKGRLQEELHDLGSYYKWPLFLWSLGRVDLAEQLFHVIVVDFMTADGDFRTGEGELLTDLEIPERLQRIYLDRPDQAYVYLGMSAVFLARLFAVAGEERFLAGARGYFAINAACGDRVYRGIGCCKTGWSAATLYRLTGEEQYRQSVRKAAAEILSLQQSGGDWKLPDASTILECDVNGELGYHLTQYCLELAGGGSVD